MTEIVGTGEWQRGVVDGAVGGRGYGAVPAALVADLALHRWGEMWRVLGGETRCLCGGWRGAGSRTRRTSSLRPTAATLRYWEQLPNGKQVLWERCAKKKGRMGDLRSYSDRQICYCKMSPSLPPASRSPWASMPEDLVRLVAWRLLAGDMMDYVRLRDVCTNWRSSTISPRGRGVIDPRFHPRRWMMFAEGRGLYPGHEDLREHVRFFNLDSGIFVRVRLPLFKDHCILDSVEGLLVLQRDDDTAIRLLNPFTCDIIELPPLTYLAMDLKNDCYVDEEETTMLKQMRRISASVSVAAGGVVRVMVILMNLMRAAVVTSQDMEWTLLPWRVPSHCQPLSSRGKHYLAGGNRRVSQVFQIEAHLQDPPKLIATIPSEKLSYPVYLVECDSEVLVIGHNDRSLTHLAVHKLADLVSEQYVPLKSIGGKAILVGGRVMSVSSESLPTITGDTVVYRHPSQIQFLQYCLRSSSWSPATDECSMSGQGQGPCSLIHHVFTCCNNRVWNKGLMFSQDKWPLAWKVKQEFRDGA